MLPFLHQLASHWSGDTQMHSESQSARALRQRVALLLVLASALAGTSVAQIWVASTGTVDEDSLGSISFVGGFAQLRPTGTISSATLRYNVLPVGSLVQPITQP